jgi:transcription termination factor NusB
VELAKVFGSDSTPRFVNGVLGSVMASLDSGELAAAEPSPDGR